ASRAESCYDERMFDQGSAARGPALAGQLAALHLPDVDAEDLIDALSAAEQLARWATAAQLAVTGELVRRREDPQFVEFEIAGAPVPGGGRRPARSGPQP